MPLHVNNKVNMLVTYVIAKTIYDPGAYVILRKFDDIFGFQAITAKIHTIYVGDM